MDIFEYDFLKIRDLPAFFFIKISESQFKSK